MGIGSYITSWGKALFGDYFRPMNGTQAIASKGRSDTTYKPRHTSLSTRVRSAPITSKLKEQARSLGSFLSSFRRPKLRQGPSHQFHKNENGAQIHHSIPAKDDAKIAQTPLTHRTMHSTYGFASKPIKKIEASQFLDKIRNRRYSNGKIELNTAANAA